MTTNRQPTNGVLAQLRARCPKRGLNSHEAAFVAEQQAQLLLALTGTTEVPVPTRVLQRLPRIELAVEKLPSSGLSHWTGTAWRLVANAADHPHRQRFSLFHEFKHAVDHSMSDLLYATEAQRERAADRFAAAVLMPRQAVTRAWCAGEQDVGQLAEYFVVSPEAMQRRLQQLGLSDRRPTRTYVCARGLRTRRGFAIAGGMATALGGTR